MPFCITLRVLALTATTLGSLSTMPWPRMQTSVLQVPRSMPRSTLNMPSIFSKNTRMTPW